VTRGVPRTLGRCELTFLEREPIDVDRAVAQHADYTALLRDLGLEVLEIPADPAFPDCCFVEDVAVVLDRLAVLTRPGAPSRRGEIPSVEDVLARFRPLARIEAPATLEGGDVLEVASRLFVGTSPRTNAAGRERLRELAEPLGYRVIEVPVTGCLHLKSAVTALGEDRVLANPAWIEVTSLRGLEVIPVASEEPGAANVLRVNDTIVAHSGFPRTVDRIAALGLDVRPLDVSEFLKAEAALTCKSLLFPRQRARGPAPRDPSLKRGPSDRRSTAPRFAPAAGRRGGGAPRGRGRAG
jgi:dimethylargininase